MYDVFYVFIRTPVLSTHPPTTHRSGELYYFHKEKRKVFGKYRGNVNDAMDISHSVTVPVLGRNKIPTPKNVHISASYITGEKWKTCSPV